MSQGYKLTVNLTVADSQRAAREFVRRAMQATGYTSTRLAREAELSPSTLNRFLSGKDVKHTLSNTTLSKIAKVAKLPDPFDAVEAATTYVMPRLRSHDRGTRDLPIMGMALGGNDHGIFDLNGHVIDRVERPALLSDVPDAYAVYMRGSSMLPKYDDGQLLYINPHKPCRPGDYVVCEFTDHRALVKRFVRRDGKHVTFEQFEPRQELVFDAASILHIHKIVSADEIG